MKKILSLVLALCMILTIGAAFADGDTYSETMTVSGLGNGDQAFFYQIVNWVGEAEGNVTGWKAIGDYAQVLTTDVLKAVLVGDPDADPGDDADAA